MAITSAEVTVWHTALNKWLKHGRVRMRKISLFAVAAAVIATGFGVWAASNTNARVAPSMGQGVEPFQIMMNAKEVPTAEFADYTFVFH
jgi:hypothetical protein